jgi:hypothetical protein
MAGHWWRGMVWWFSAKEAAYRVSRRAGLRCCSNNCTILDVCIAKLALLGALRPASKDACMCAHTWLARGSISCLGACMNCMNALQLCACLSCRGRNIRC